MHAPMGVTPQSLFNCSPRTGLNRLLIAINISTRHLLSSPGFFSLLPETIYPARLRRIHFHIPSVLWHLIHEFRLLVCNCCINIVLCCVSQLCTRSFTRVFCSEYCTRSCSALTLVYAHWRYTTVKSTHLNTTRTREDQDRLRQVTPRTKKHNRLWASVLR